MMYLKKSISKRDLEMQKNGHHFKYGILLFSSLVPKGVALFSIILSQIKIEFGLGMQCWKNHRGWK